MRPDPRKETAAGRPLTGPEKAAVLLALVGEKTATALAGELEERELVMLRQGIHRMSQIEPEHIEQVFEDTRNQLTKANIFLEESADYLLRVLTKAMGPEKANSIIGRIFHAAEEFNGVEALHEMDAKTLAHFLQEEHPQTIAFILAHLYPSHAGEVFSLLPDDKQNDVAYRITRLGSTPPGVIEEVSNVLRNEIRQVQGKQMGGARPVAEILNYVDKATEERVLIGLSKMEPELAENVRRMMFTFEDLAKIDDLSMQVLIREVEREKWVMAMRTSSPTLKKKIFANMSERAGALLKEELESMGPVRLRDVEAVQRDILDYARKLEAEGKVYLTSGKTKEDILV
ncbi:MAG TPA: flagellar motor switch protein FliG [Candidatus Binatia bacterium]|jgi:flagellar motor switch protein FliG